MQLTEINSKFVKAGSFSVVETKQIAWLINVYIFFDMGVHVFYYVRICVV